MIPIFNEFCRKILQNFQEFLRENLFPQIVWQNFEIPLEEFRQFRISP